MKRRLAFILAALAYGGASFAYGLDPDAPDSATLQIFAIQPSHYFSVPIGSADPGPASSSFI